MATGGCQNGMTLLWFSGMPAFGVSLRVFFRLFLGDELCNGVYGADNEAADVLVVDMDVIGTLQRHDDFKRVNGIELDYRVVLKERDAVVDVFGFDIGYLQRIENELFNFELEFSGNDRCHGVFPILSWNENTVNTAVILFYHCEKRFENFFFFIGAHHDHVPHRRHFFRRKVPVLADTRHKQGNLAPFVAICHHRL
jgi:hypothetical protein